MGLTPRLSDQRNTSQEDRIPARLLVGAKQRQTLGAIDSRTLKADPYLPNMTCPFTTAVYALKGPRRPYAMSVANKNPFAILGGEYLLLRSLQDDFAPRQRRLAEQELFLHHSQPLVPLAFVAFHGQSLLTRFLAPSLPLIFRRRRGRRRPQGCPRQGCCPRRRPQPQRNIPGAGNNQRRGGARNGAPRAAAGAEAVEGDQPKDARAGRGRNGESRGRGGRGVDAVLLEAVPSTVTRRPTVSTRTRLSPRLGAVRTARRSSTTSRRPRPMPRLRAPRLSPPVLLPRR